MSKLFPTPNWIKSTVQSMYGEELLEAVVRVYVRWKEAGLNPGSDYLTVSTRNRLKAEQEVERKWRELVFRQSGIEPGDLDYPYHGDWVMQMWVAFRKTGSEEKDELFEFYGMTTRTTDWNKKGKGNDSE